jgi:hypothetical protein
MSLVDANRQLAQDLPQLFLRIQRANVTVYPVDPCGAGGFQKYVMQQASTVPLLRQDSEANRRAGVGDESGALAPPGFSFLNPSTGVPTPATLKYMSTISMDFLEAAAANTGGRPIVNTNDFEAGLDQIFEENASYYLLGYQQPANQLPDRGTHQGKCESSGVFVRTRSGYATDDAPKKKTRLPHRSPLDKAIVNAVPKGRSRCALHSRRSWCRARRIRSLRSRSA